MSELALQRIREAKEQRLTRLDIGNCGLTEIPDEVFELTWLEELHLSGGRSDNDGKKNNIKAFNPKIRILKGLKILIAGGQEELSDLSPLAHLTALQQLDINRTKVSDLRPLKDLTALQQLNAFLTQVSNLSPLKDLKALQLLYVNSTQVRDLSPLKDRILNGWAVKCESAESWEDIGIYLKNCPLMNPPQEIVEQGNEAILSYWKQISRSIITENVIKGAKIIINDKLWISDDFETINKYSLGELDLIIEKNKLSKKYGIAEEINEAKLIIVGEGATGKTTLFEKLKDPTHDPIKNPTPETHGINILEGLLMKDAFRANLWDFGGQELQYMTHQFFLTPRALYVLMMDARRESPNLAYWFKIISLLGRESDNEKAQVLLVFNKKKDSTGTPQYMDLLKDYESDFDYESITVDFADNDYRWDNLKNSIEHRLSSLTIKLPKQWKPIREALREEAKEYPHISLQRFSEICTLHKVSDETDQLMGSKALHKLGQILHFDEKGLRSHLILSPKWAVDGVYTFLEAETRNNNNGRFTEAQFLKTLQAKGYKSDGADLILLLMTRNNFDICYQSTDGNYVAAQLLPDNRPNEFIWHPETSYGGALQFRYQYPTMPKGLISRLIVRLSNLIEEINGVEVVWKKGAILRIEKDGHPCRILIQEDDGESKNSLKRIKIDVLGEPNYRKFALQKVRDEVENLHKKMVS